jgi:hypothetical protein
MDRGEDPHNYVAMGAHWGVTRAGLGAPHRGRRLERPVRERVQRQDDLDREWSGATEGVEGRRIETYWRNPQAPHLEPQDVTPEAIATLHEVVRYEHTRLTVLGARMTKFLSHRQSSGSRPSDPGSEWWQLGALPIMEELGYDDGGAGFAIDDGRPNPHEWNERRTERY